MECKLVFVHEEDEVTRGNLPSKFHDPSEILRLGDAFLFCKREGSFHRDPHPHLSAEWIAIPLKECKIQTVNFFLPFIRLRLKTFRPLRVLILSKNPCVLLRLRLLGWYVLFIESLYIRVAYFLKRLNFYFKPHLLPVVKITSQFCWQNRGFYIRFCNEI